ncbi:urotensin 2, alpha [Scyliorhinus canicula]|uniref:urotensin 2, alpha n=1 Tax=Scyliorhinus canicula TaxID=7830 RepID=UPI0018F55AA8|nr:urotensin 2, alpha [Scyliorhinus canicula]
MMSLVLVAGVLLLSGSCVFAVPIADSLYRAGSSEENQPLSLDELQSLDNNLLWNPSATMSKASLYDAIRDLEAAEQLKNGLREISDTDLGNVKEILYGRRTQPKAGRLLTGKGRKQYKKRNNFSDCFWKYCV